MDCTRRLVLVVKVNATAAGDVQFSCICNLIIAHQTDDVRTGSVADSQVSRASPVGNSLIQRDSSGIDEHGIETVGRGAAENEGACVGFGDIKSTCDISRDVQQIASVLRYG